MEYSDYSKERSKYLTTQHSKLSSIASSLQQVNIYHKVHKNDAEEMNDIIQDRIVKLDESMKQFKCQDLDELGKLFMNIKKFVNHLNKCINPNTGKIDYSGTKVLSHQNNGWYREYSGQAINIIIGYGDNYFLDRDSTLPLSLVE